MIYNIALLNMGVSSNQSAIGKVRKSNLIDVSSIMIIDVVGRFECKRRILKEKDVQ